MSPTAKKSRFSAFFKVLRKIITVSFVTATVFVGLLLILIQFPSVQRTAVNTVFDQFGSDFGFRIRLDSLHINWFKGTIQADNIRMMPVPMDSPARITIESLSLDIRVRDYFRGLTTIKMLSVVNPVFTIEQMPDGVIKWPWVTQPQPDEAPPKPDKKPKDQDAPAFPDTLRIDSATIVNGQFEMRARNSKLPPTAIEGLSLSVSTEPGLTNLLGELIINSAHWRNPTTEETLTLTQPLTLNLHTDSQPIYVALNCEISGFPVTLDGHVSPLTEVMTYDVSLKGKGPVTNILNTFGVTGVSTDELDISINAASDGMLAPELALSAKSPGLTVGPTQFDTVTLASTLSQETLHADLIAETGPGRMSIALESTVVPSVADWSADIAFRRFPLDMIEPWIPDMLDLKGLVDGAVSASGPSTDWTETDAAGTLTIARIPGRVRPPATVSSDDTPHYVLRPEGTLDLTFRNQQLNLTRMNLIDDSLRVNVSGFWNIPDQAWSASAAIHSDDLTPWAAMAGFNAGGKADITATMAQSEKDADIAGEGHIELLNAFYDTFDIPVAQLDITIAESRFSADIEQLVFDDLTLAGNASGDMVMPEHATQKITLRLDTLIFRDLPEQALTAAWERSARGQKATVQTDDDTVRAELTSPPAGGWKGFCILEDFDLSLAGSFLPEPLNDLTGALTSRIELDTTLPNDAMEIAVRLDDLTVTIMERTIRTAQPGHIVYRPESVSVSELVLRTDDGSRVSANGLWALKDTFETELHTDISIPALQSWPIPGAPDDLEGAVTADLIVRSKETDIVPEGTVSATNVTVSGMHIADMDILLSPPEPPNAFSVILTVNGFRPGTGDDIPEISTKGKIDIGPGYESFDTLSVSVMLDMLEAAFPDPVFRNDGPLIFHLRNQQALVEQCVITGPDMEVTLQGGLALTDQISEPERLTAHIRAGLEPLSGFLPDTGLFAGNLKADIAIDGSVAAPVITGETQLLDISWDNPDFPGPVERLNGVIQLTDDDIRFQNVSFRFGGGRIEIPGTITRDGMTLNEFNVSARIRDINMDATPDLFIRGGGDVHLQGDWPDIGLTGTVRITEALYTPEFDLLDLLADLTRPRVVIADDTPEADEVRGLPLDLTVLAQDNIRIENSHMNLSLDARMQITGTTAVPGVLGAVTLKRGVIDLLLHEFEITSGNVNFTTPFEIDPSLDIKAETITRGEVIRFHITGRASRPNLLLSSDSGKSHSEIMTLLIGQDLTTGESDLGAMAMDYAKHAAARAAAQAIGARTDLIVVPFPVRHENENLLVGVGRQFGDRWKFMYYFGEKSEEGNVIELEYELNPKTDLRFRQNQDGTVSGGFRYRHTFN